MKPVWVPLMLACALCAQQPPAPAPAKPLVVQSPSSITIGSNKDGQTTIDIRNVSYRVTGQGVPGLPVDQRLLLRLTTRNREVLDEIGVRATVVMEAWPFGT